MLLRPKRCRPSRDLVLGRFEGKLLRHVRSVHLSTFAPSGAGKLVSTLAPVLLSYNGSVFVIDPKGELLAKTKSAREAMGHRVIAYDPWGISGQRSASHNPLSVIGGSTLVDACRITAGSLVTRTGKEHDTHWLDSAETLLTALCVGVCHLAEQPEERNLQTVRDFMACTQRLSGLAALMAEGQDLMLQRMGHVLAGFADPASKEMSSVRSTASRQLEFLDSPAMLDVTQSSTIDPLELRDGKTDVFVIVPADRLSAFSRWLRLMVVSFVQRLIQSGTLGEKSPVLFLIDEAGQLERMDYLIRTAVPLMRGYGVKIWTFFQSYNQLAEIYGTEAAKVFLANVETQWFGINDYDTADLISRKIGEATIHVRSYNDGQSFSVSDNPAQPGGSTQYGNSGGSTLSEQSRRLLQPSEVIQLPPEKQILFLRGCPPILCDRIIYYRDEAFRHADEATGSTTQCQEALDSLWWLVLLCLVGWFVWLITS